MPISKPGHYVESIEILTEPERRRRRTAQEKIAIVQETLEPGASVSAVARRHGVMIEREQLALPGAPNEVWSIDFVMDALSNGR
ncbi:transposase, partial [Burkholderia cenocepacia]